MDAWLRGLATFVLVGLALSLTVACRNESVTELETEPEADAPSNRVAMASLSCTGSIVAETLACGVHDDSEPKTGRSLDIVGGQGTYLRLKSTNVHYDEAAQTFFADVTVQNLMDKPLGTPDGSEVTGVFVFFHSGPNATSGHGTIKVGNPDGVDSFTGADQPYHEYREMLRADETTAPKTWEWFVPRSVRAFEFAVYVAADVPDKPQTATELKVAFIADQGRGSDALAVLRLIRDEGADMVLHQGDFDYNDDPAGWDANITSVLGADFPYFASVGNHDEAAFFGTGGYQEKLQQRLDRVLGATCTGDLGVNAACRYHGLFFILSGVGTLGSGHETYMRDQLAADSSTWRICSWHKNQNAMQVGGKGDAVGWGPYKVCRELGAIIATGHEHSYSRTKTLISLERQTVDPAWPDPARLRVTPGATFVFVSGLGGASIRDQQRCLPATYPYGCSGEWASIYTSNQGAQFGALFIEFHVGGDPHKARGYFKNLDGQVVDEFTVTSE